MERTTHKRNNRHHEYDLSADLARIRAALADASYDVKGRAGEIINESFENVKQKSAAVQENVSDYVAEKPIKSIGLALLSGVVIGYLLHK